MKLSLLVSLLVLSTFLCEAQGIRLGKVSMPTGNIHGRIQKEGSLMERSTANSGGDVKSTVAACKDDENFSGGILSKKLMSKPPSSTSTTTTTSSKNHANDANKDGHAVPKAKPSGSKGHNIAGKKAKLSISPSPFTKYREVTRPEQYPDIIDIAGMDYSPARRKPPIHN